MTAQTSDILTTLQVLAENFASAFASGDAANIAEFYTEDGMLLPAGSDFIKGKQAIKEYWQAAIDMGIKSIKLDIMEVEQHNDTAIEMSKYTLSSADDQVIDSGKGIVIWKNKGGAWKLHRDIWNSSLEQE
ncbi:YybH family protein [Thermodesulfobacteriota bacterium]